MRGRRVCCVVTSRWHCDTRRRLAAAGGERRGEIGKGWGVLSVPRSIAMTATTTYDEAGLHQTNGDGMIKKGIGERDERDDKPVLSLASWAQSMRCAMDGAPELEVGDLADSPIRLSVREARMIGVMLDVKVARIGEEQAFFEGDVSERARPFDGGLSAHGKKDLPGGRQVSEPYKHSSAH